jgi:hypothetical protein
VAILIGTLVLARRFGSSSFFHGFLVAVGVFLSLDIVVVHWIFRLHRVTAGPEANVIEPILVAFGVGFVIYGLRRERRSSVTPRRRERGRTGCRGRPAPRPRRTPAAGTRRKDATMTTNGPVQRLSTPRRIDRRAALGRLLALTLLVPPAVGVLTGCGHRDQPGMGDGGMPGWMMSGDQMMDAQMMADMPAIHDLLVRHDTIRRQVDDIEGGIRARTTSDPSIAQLIQTHVQQMKARIETGTPIRQMDPLFREIFEHHGAITMTVSQIPGGVEVTETSSNPQVALLIRQHAHHAVSEFVARGTDRAMRPTPLPAGYRD